MPSIASSMLLSASLLGIAGATWSAQQPPASIGRSGEPDAARIIEAFGKQGIRIDSAEARDIRPDVLLALREAKDHGIGNSKVDFAAVEIARDLGLDTGTGSAAVKHVLAALGWLAGRPASPDRPPVLAWETYFRETIDLWNQPDFMDLMNRNQFHPVKISWEDIGRDENSAGDVGEVCNEIERVAVQTGAGVAYGHHFANLMAYSGAATANNSSFYRWIESKASHSREENVRKTLFTLNTSIACGMKGALWFLGTDFVAGMYARDLKGSFDKHEGPFQWNSVGEDAVKVNKEIMPLAREIMKIGNPVAVYSTPTTKDMGNADLPADQVGKVPGGLAPFPADFWVQPAGGEFVMGVFKDDGKRDAIFVANHNSLAPQDVRLKFAKPVKVSLFSRKEAKWTAVPAGGNTVSFKLEGGGGELLRVE